MKVARLAGASVLFPSPLRTSQDYAKLIKHIFENEMLNGEVIGQTAPYVLHQDNTEHPTSLLFL